MTPITRVGSLAICLVLSLASTAALSNLVAVVSSKSAITILSKSQTADLFLGRVSRFPNGVQAAPIDQAEGAAAREEFYVLVAGKSAAQMKTYWSKIIFTGRGQPPKEVTSGAPR